VRRRATALLALATAAAPLAPAGCSVVHQPEGVVGGVDLPANLSTVLRPGMRAGEVIALFGAPSKRTQVGQVTTLLYSEAYQSGHDRVRLFWSAIGSGDRTQTQLHLVFLDDALVQAWADLSGVGQEPERRWLLGSPSP